MVDVLQVTFEVGEGAPIGVVSEAVADLAAIVHGAQELAFRITEAEATETISSILRSEGPVGLVEEARRRELPGTYDREEFDASELENLWFLTRRTWYSSAISLGRASLGGIPLRSSLVDQLLASEVSRRLGEEPYRLRSISYRNPIDAEFVLAAGSAAVAIGYLLTVIRDWGPRRRRATAVANDAEDQALMRAYLRREAFNRIARGELPVSQETYENIFSDAFVRSADRISMRELEFRNVNESDEGVGS